MRNSSLSEKMFTFVLIFSPVLRVYAIRGVSIDMILMPICSFFLLLYDLKFRKKQFALLGTREQLLLLPIITISISTILACCYESYSLVTSLGRIFLLFFYSMVLIQARDHIDYLLAKKILRYLCLIVVAGLVLQLVLYYVAGIRFQMFIPGLETTIEEVGDFYIVDEGFYRPKSIFNEASHVAYFLSIGLMRELFWEKRINWFWAVTCSLGMILSVSGTGIGLVTCIWILYLLSNRNIIETGQLLLVSIFAFLFLQKFGLIDQVLYSYGRASLDNGRINSFIGYYIQFDGIEKIFGVGMGNVTDRFSSYLVSRSSFVSGFGRFLVEGGLISLFVYIISYFRLLLKIRFPEKAFLVLFLIMNMFESTIFGIYYPLILMWIFNKDRKIIN